MSQFLTSAWLFSDVTKKVDPTRWMSYHSSSSCKSGGFFHIISSHSMKQGVNQEMLPSQFFFGHRIVGPGYATFWTRPELAGQHLGPWECLPCLVAVTFWCLRRPFLPRRRCVCCHNLQAAQKPLNVPSLLKPIDVQLSKMWKWWLFVLFFGPDLFEKSHASLLRARSMWALCVDICLSLIRSWCSQRCEIGEWLGGVEQVVSPPSWCGDEKEAKLSWVFGPVLEALQSG